MDAINIFGGTGFIGSAYLDRFGGNVNARNDYCPKTNNVLYFISTGDNYNVFDNLQIDITTNLSTLMTVIGNIKNPKDTTFNFISSWFVYGDSGRGRLKEDAYCNPKGFYSITKRAAESLLISYCETMGMKYRILRLANVIGPNDGKVSAKRNALQFLIEKLEKNEPVDLYEGGHVRRNFLYIDDCVDAINLVLEKGATNEIYNIGNGISMEMLDVIQQAKALLGSTSELRSIPTPEFHKVVQVRDIALDIDKLFDLGFDPKYPMPAMWLPKLLEK